MSKRTEISELDNLRKELAVAQSKSLRAAQARAELGAGASRARVTSANARWASAAEERDRIQRAIAALEKANQWKS